MVPADTLRKLDLFDGLSARRTRKTEDISELVDYPRGHCRRLAIRTSSARG